LQGLWSSLVVRQKRNAIPLVLPGKKRNLEDNMQSDSFLDNLKNHIPEKSVDLIWPLIKDFDFNLTVTKERKTKHGDYRMPNSSGQSHRISVNGTLNKYAFLLTFIHEVAHMHTFEIYGRRISPHGKEWKRTFKKVAKPFLLAKVWPEDITLVLKNHFINPKASSAGDIVLTRVLRKYDDNKDVFLEDLEEDSFFAINNEFGRQFVKGKKRRTRYLCSELETHKTFTIHGMAKVFEIKENE
jgi:SprT protein